MKRSRTAKGTALMLSLLVALSLLATGGGATGDLGRYGLPMEPTTFTFFIDHTWYSTDKYEGKIPSYIQEDTGVSLDCTRAADSQQLIVLASSGDLPDMVFASNSAKRAQLSSAELCYDYDALIAEYCPVWEPEPDRIMTARFSATDGKYYYLSNAYQNSDMWKDAKVGVPNYPMLYYHTRPMGNLEMRRRMRFCNIRRIWLPVSFL